jgi:hypothetical protein
MLPATLQFLITMIACAINERMQHQLDYTQEEVRVLKEIVAAMTGNGRLSLTADQRRRLAVAGKALSRAGPLVANSSGTSLRRMTMGKWQGRLSVAPRRTSEFLLPGGGVNGGDRILAPDAVVSTFASCAESRTDQSVVISRCCLRLADGCGGRKAISRAAPPPGLSRFSVDRDALR